MSDDKDSSTARVPKFSGKKDDWHVWSTQFKALLGYKECHTALTDGGFYLPNSDSELLDETTDADKIKAKKCNAKAMFLLTMAMVEQEDLEEVTSTHSSQWTTGLAHVAWSNLKTIYEPDDTMTFVEVEEKKQAIKMANANEDPKVMFQKLQKIKKEYERLQEPISDTQLMVQAQIGAHPMYQQTVLNALAENNATLQTVKVAMAKHYRFVQVRNGNKNKAEVSLVVAGTFSGNCNMCGQQGHKARNCPNGSNGGNNNNNGNKTKKFTGKCNGCGKQGHKLIDCWLAEANKNKRPEWLQKKLDNKEVGAVATDNSPEIMLISQEVFCQTADTEDEDDDDSLADMPALVPHSTPMYDSDDEEIERRHKLAASYDSDTESEDEAPPALLEITTTWYDSDDESLDEDDVTPDVWHENTTTATDANKLSLIVCHDNRS